METYKVTVYNDGTTRWYNAKDEYHRVGGPAIECADGGKEWYLEGKLHRSDGPAVVYIYGHRHWYLEGKEYTEAEYNKKIKSPSCEGKVVEIDGKKYKLVGV